MKTNEKTVSNQYFADLQVVLYDLEMNYTDIHSHPELTMQERRAAGIAAEHLRKARLDVSGDIASMF